MYREIQNGVGVRYQSSLIYVCCLMIWQHPKLTVLYAFSFSKGMCTKSCKSGYVVRSSTLSIRTGNSEQGTYFCTGRRIYKTYNWKFHLVWVLLWKSKTWFTFCKADVASVRAKGKREPPLIDCFNSVGQQNTRLFLCIKETFKIILIFALFVTELYQCWKPT